MFAETVVSETAEVIYNIDENGNASFQYLIELSTEPAVATAISKFTISFPFEDLNFTVIKADGKDIEAKIEREDIVKSLILEFDNRIINHSNPMKLEIQGRTKDKFMEQIENTRVLILPASISNIEAKKITIRYPKSFGNISDPRNQWKVVEEGEIIKLMGSKVGRTINLLWGDRIIYEFNIKKTLLNNPDEPSKTFDINIPKTHGNQKVIFSKIEPVPNFAYQDAEKNLFFTYELEPNTEIEIDVSGQIEIDLSKGRKNDFNLFEKPVLTETKGYWLLDDEYELNRLKLRLTKEGITEESVDTMEDEMKKKFYRVVYDYVIERLNFANMRTSSMESNIRQGANYAVKNRASAAPEDYVDLLMAIYRSYDVPTRMIEGYVKMLNHGFYHSWVEFWDSEKGWQSIDPALQDYSNADFFEMEIFNHIPILSRGYNYIRPRMMFFDQNDFTITFPKNILNENLLVENTIRLSPLKKNHNELTGIIEITNIGNTIIFMEDFTQQEEIFLGNYNALQLIVPGQSASVPFIYKSDTMPKNKKILLEYTSINGEKLLNPVEIDIQEEQFWWWNPLILTLKFTTISIITYVLYIIFSKTFKWIKRYYQ